MINDCESDFNYMKKELDYKNIPIPKYFSNYINLKKIFPLDVKITNKDYS